MGKYIKSFSLFELLIVVGLVTLGAVITIPISTSQLQNTKVEVIVKDLKSRLFSLQQDAYTQKNDEGQGIFFNNTNYVIFSGNSFETATDTRIIQIPKGITVTQNTFTSSQIFFEKGSFRPTSPGFIVLTDGINSYNININKEGLTIVTKL